MKKALIALAGVVLAVAANAQTYPSQPIRWIVPYAAGGGTDTMARRLADAIRPDLGQTVVVDNRPGAATNIAVAALTQSKPDGYTVMQAENAALLFNEHMFAKLPYSPEKDFTYIGAIGRVPLALVVHPSFPASTLKEFVARVKSMGDKVDYASPGVGTPHHMAMELLKQRAGLQATHVPYKGAAPALQDLMGGQISVMMLDLASGIQYIRSGKVRPLAIALPQRAAGLPDVPTFAENGLEDVNAFAFHGLIGPAGMPADVVDRLNTELNKAMKKPKVVELFTDFGFEPLPGSPSDFRSLARSESARWGTVIRTSGVKLD
jgi:tripartite-type tricarboxylate transporter receptor subunit TctC